MDQTIPAARMMTAPFPRAMQDINNFGIKEFVSVWRSWMVEVGDLLEIDRWRCGR